MVLFHLNLFQLNASYLNLQFQLHLHLFQIWNLYRWQMCTVSLNQSIAIQKYQFLNHVHISNQKISQYTLTKQQIYQYQISNYKLLPLARYQLIRNFVIKLMGFVEAVVVLLLEWCSCQGFGQLYLDYESILQLILIGLKRLLYMFLSSCRILYYYLNRLFLMKHQRQRSRQKKFRERNYSRQRNHSRQRQRYREYMHEQKRDYRNQNRDRDYERNRRPQYPPFTSYPIKDRPKIQQHIQQNRSLGCPFLVKIYYSINQANTYRKQQDLPKDREQILYLWMSSTLKQITELLRAHMPSIRTKQKFVYHRVYQENNRLLRQQLGVVNVQRKMGYIDSKDENLANLNFHIGDYIDVSIHYN